MSGYDLMTCLGRYKCFVRQVVFSAVKLSAVEMSALDRSHYGHGSPAACIIQ